MSRTVSSNLYFLKKKINKRVGKKACTRACADSRCTRISEVCGSLGPFLVHKPPSLPGCLLLNDVHGNLALGTGSASRRARSLHKHPEKQPEQTSLLEAVPGIFSPKRFGAGERERALGFSRACSSHQRHPPAAPRRAELSRAESSRAELS